MNLNLSAAGKLAYLPTGWARHPVWRAIRPTGGEGRAVYAHLFAASNAGNDNKKFVGLTFLTRRRGGAIGGLCEPPHFKAADSLQAPKIGTLAQPCDCFAYLLPALPGSILDWLGSVEA